MDQELELSFQSAKGDELDTEALVHLVYHRDGDIKKQPVPTGLHQKQFDDFDAESGETSLFYEGDFKSEKLILLGGGELDEIEATDLAEVGGQVVDSLKDLDVETASLVIPTHLDLSSDRLTRELVMGLELGSYEFDEYLHEEDEEDDDESEDEVELEEIELILEDRRSESAVKRGFDRGQDLAGAIGLARDLGNTPSNDLVPYDLAEEARDLGSRYSDLSVKIWEQDDLIDENMNLLNGVGKGSENPPCLILFDYSPSKPKETVAFAGKGVTFDSGGISIKPSKGMDEMKFDMGGSAAVFGIIQAVSELELPLRVLGIVPSAENMPGQDAIKPGDVITGYAGKSVEILNTDAEGRLCLADALGYLCENYGDEIDQLIDLATLTGACITALGHEAAGLMGNDDELCDDLMDVGQDVNEPVWQLPLWDDHSEQMDSEIADVKNIGGDAGAITAGAFLREFVDEDKIDYWAHLDVAGTAWGMKELPYRPKGGTGFGVYLSVEYLRRSYSLGE